MTSTPVSSLNPGTPANGLIAIAALASAFVGISLATIFSGVDSALRAQLLHLFDSSGSVTRVVPAFAESGSGATSLIANSVLCVALGTAACLAGRLSAVPRSICGLQLLVLSLLAQWLLTLVHVEPKPLSFIAVIFFALSCGYLLRLKRLDASKVQANVSELALRKRELREARLLMVKQDEIDRRLLAADLHDQVLNDLKVLNQKIQTYRSEPTNLNASEIDKLVQQSMNGVRDVMDSLSPAVLEHLGFAAALEDCIKRASERSGGFKVRFRNNFGVDDFSQLNLIEQTLLYRLVQECGTNICKHAGATMVKVSLENQNGDLMIRVADNGNGIPEGVDISASRGLQYMRQRGDLIGATIAWMPGENGQGTTVEIRMPIKGQAS